MSRLGGRARRGAHRSSPLPRHHKRPPLEGAPRGRLPLRPVRSRFFGGSGKLAGGGGREPRCSRPRRCRGWRVPPRLPTSSRCDPPWLRRDGFSGSGATTGGPAPRPLTGARGDRNRGCSAAASLRGASQPRRPGSHRLGGRPAGAGGGGDQRLRRRRPARRDRARARAGGRRAGRCRADRRRDPGGYVRLRRRARLAEPRRGHDGDAPHRARGGR